MNLSLSPLLLLLCVCVVVHGVQHKKILSLHNNIWSNVEAFTPCFSHNLGKGRGESSTTTTLEMKHKGFCSNKAINWSKKLRKALVLDDIRVQSIQFRIKAMSLSSTDSVSETQIPITSGINLKTLNYIVTVELGGKNMTLIVDTGSDLTWVQCQPCKSCYNQQGAFYDPSNSSSYQTVFCNSSTCQDLVATTGNLSPCGGTNNGVKHTTCDYVVSYGDGSYTRGELGSESIQLGYKKVENFVFGCGRNNKGLFGGASGLMGLGRSSVSLVSQTSTTFNGVFSYCLPSLEDGASGSLSFGNDFTDFKNSTPFSFTPLVQNPQLQSFYILNLTGASIGGVALESSSFGKGILIDSGTVITRLQPSIYKAVKSEFLKQFSGFPSAPSYSILDTCFNLTSYEEVSIPTLKLVFEDNTELEVDVSGVFYFVKPDASLVCLALASLSYENEIGIIGNYQQKNQRIIYDTKQDKLGIAGENCSS